MLSAHSRMLGGRSPRVTACRQLVLPGFLSATGHKSTGSGVKVSIHVCVETMRRCALGRSGFRMACYWGAALVPSYD